MPPSTSALVNLCLDLKLQLNVLPAIQTGPIDVFADVVQGVAWENHTARGSVLRALDLKFDLAHLLTDDLHGSARGTKTLVYPPAHGRVDPEDQVIDLVVPMRSPLDVGSEDHMGAREVEPAVMVVGTSIVSVMMNSSLS